jgi:glycogen synthase
MNETRILLAAVLKPVNDSRMFRKLGLSLAKLPNTRIQVVGYRSPEPAAPANISFFPIFSFKRLGLGRFLASGQFFKLLWRLSPHIIILGTHELLLITVIYKIFRPCQIIYDVRENYYLNLTSQKVYPPVISLLLATSIRLTERFAARFIRYFFLAEKSYAPELPFLQNRYLILENKYQTPTPTPPIPAPFPGRKIPTGGIQLLYSGTISVLYGVFRAVALCEALNQVKPVFRLTIIGYCPQPEVLLQLKTRIANNAAITLIGGDVLVAHEQIVENIQKSHIGLLPYQLHPSTFNCVPTKLFEYLGHALPVLVQQNPLWEELLTKYDAGLAIDFGHFDATAIWDYLANHTFYEGKNLSEVYWNSEEKKLQDWAQTTILPA